MTEVMIGGLASWRSSFQRHPRTQQSSAEAIDELGTWLTAGAGRPLEPSEITTAHVEGLIADHLGRECPSTAANRYRSLE